MKSLKEVNHLVIDLDKRVKNLEDMMKNVLEIKIKCIENWEKEFETEIQQLIKKNQVKEREVVPNIIKQVLKCKDCDEKFNSKKTLKKHCAVKHFKIYKCTVCDKSFDVSWKYELHLQEHDRIMKFNCHKCGKTFVSEWRLEKQVIHITRFPDIRLPTVKTVT